MRCLYCGKKLSLLKLAKGDSFCTPEHSDAHQVKMSKDAFERLMRAQGGDQPGQQAHQDAGPQAEPRY